MAWFSAFRKIARNFKAERDAVEAEHQAHIKGRTRRLRAATDDIFRTEMVNPALLSLRDINTRLKSDPMLAGRFSDAVLQHQQENNKHDATYKAKMAELDRAEAEMKSKQKVRNQQVYQDPNVRQRLLDNQRERYQQNPDAQKSVMNERYRTDPKVNRKQVDGGWERRQVKWFGLGDCQCGCQGDSKKHLKIWSKAFDKEYDGILQSSISEFPCGCGCKGNVKKHLESMVSGEFPVDPKEETESMGRIALAGCNCGCGGNLNKHMETWRETNRRTNRTPRETLPGGTTASLADFRTIKSYRTLEAAQGSFWFYNRSTNNNTNYYEEQEKLEWFEPYL